MLLIAIGKQTTITRRCVLHCFADGVASVAQNLLDVVADDSSKRFFQHSFVEHLSSEAAGNIDGSLALLFNIGSTNLARMRHSGDNVGFFSRELKRHC